MLKQNFELVPGVMREKDWAGVRREASLGPPRNGVGSERGRERERQRARLKIKVHSHYIQVSYSHTLSLSLSLSIDLGR